MAEHADVWFPWVQAVTAVDAQGASHVDNVQLIAMMSAAWRGYMNTGLGLQEHEVYSASGRPIVKAVSARFDREVHAGDQLHCGVHTLSRSTRSFTLQQVLWKELPTQPAAVGTVVLVTIDPATGTSVPIPDHLWSAIERAEGRSIEAAVSR